MKTYYHFTSNKLRDGRPIPPIGEWLEHEGPVIPCKSGLHASEHPADALKFAPGCMLHLVELDGEIIPHGDDKVVASRRRIIATIDATDLLDGYTRWCALRIIDRWDAPDIVRRFLETGDDTLRSEAIKAAWVATEARTAWVAEARAAWAAAAKAARTAWVEAETAWTETKTENAERQTQRNHLLQLVNKAFGI